MGNCASLIFTTQGSWPPVAPETGGFTHNVLSRDMDLFERATSSTGDETTIPLDSQQEAGASTREGAL